MSGFVNRGNTVQSGNVFSKLKGTLRKIAETGMKYDEKIIKNKIGIGINEQNLGGNNDPSAVYFATSSDINSKTRYTAYNEFDYVTRRDYLRTASLNSDLDEILDIISDECIILDSQNFFARPNFKAFSGFKKDNEEKIRLKLQENFEYIYTQVFEFNNSTIAWNYFKKFLVDGYLAFELVYNNNQTKLLRAVPLDVANLKPEVFMVGSAPTRVWVQNPNDEKNKRVIYDTNIIYISYTKDGFTSRISYLERLIRTFNLKRVIENTTVIWFIMNSTFRMKVIVPTSGSPQKNKQNIGQLASQFKEEVVIDEISGELKVDGQAGLNLFRNYMMASVDGQQTEIESMKLEGPDLSSPDIMKYWENKLQKESRIPASRFNRENVKEINIGKEAGGMDTEEFRFENFKNRLRSDFQEILIGPLVTQMILDFPQFKDDSMFISKIGIDYVENNMFVETKKFEFVKSKLEYIKALNELKAGEEELFPLEFLIKEHLDFDPDYMKKLEDFKKAKKKEKEDGESEEGGETEEGGTPPTP